MQDFCIFERIYYIFIIFKNRWYFDIQRKKVFSQGGIKFTVSNEKLHQRKWKCKYVNDEFDDKVKNSYLAPMAILSAPPQPKSFSTLRLNPLQLRLARVILSRALFWASRTQWRNWSFTYVWDSQWKCARLYSHAQTQHRRATISSSYRCVVA